MNCFLIGFMLLFGCDKGVTNKMDKRKPTRLHTYDYSSNGTYFLTLCTHNRRKILSKIVVGQGLGPAEIRLTDYGKIAELYINDITNRFPSIHVDKYVIMPDHIHFLISILNPTTAGASPCPTLSDVMCAYKSLTTRACKKIYPIDKLFQDSFYDHIIRNQSDYRESWHYIERNPYRWIEKHKV